MIITAISKYWIKNEKKKWYISRIIGLDYTSNLKHLDHNPNQKFWIKNLVQGVEFRDPDQIKYLTSRNWCKR